MDLKVTTNDLTQCVQKEFENKISNVAFTFGMASFEVEKKEVFELMKFLRDHPLLKFNFLTDLCGVHYPDKKLSLGVVYHLHSFKNNIRLRVKSYIDEKDGTIASVTPLWATANWMERETFDFYGIKFLGHPDLKRILNMDELDVHPLRKEYPLEDSNRVDKNEAYFGR